MKTALNRITMPQVPLRVFLEAAKTMGFDAVEVRNDLAGGTILDSVQPQDVREICEEVGIDIITINALQRFNDREEFLAARVQEFRQLTDIARDAGITAVVLCPVNDLDESRSYDERMADTVRALQVYGPVCRKSGVLAYLEPLGFPQCSLRFKKDAVAAIQQSGFEDCFKIVHDTFHHYLADEQDIFPQMTGLIHMSGVLGGKAPSAITDDDRVLVTEGDVMANREQIDALRAAGYDGYCAFECFSPEVQKLDAAELAEGIHQSLSLLF